MAAVYWHLSLAGLERVMAKIRGFVISHVWWGINNSLFVEIGDCYNSRQQGPATLCIESPFDIFNPECEAGNASSFDGIVGQSVSCFRLLDEFGCLEFRMSSGVCIQVLRGSSSPPLWYLNVHELSILGMGELCADLDSSVSIGIHDKLLGIEFSFDGLDEYSPRLLAIKSWFMGEFERT